MLARSCARCATRTRLALPRPPYGSYARVQRRTYGTPAGAPVPSPAHGTGMLAPLVTELDRMAPSFDIRGDQIQILKTPADFYETLKVRTAGRSNWRVALD